MLDVINLALPFFGLIFLGYVSGKLRKIPDTGMAWMNFFLIYIALPVLFYRILAKTPLQDLASPRFIVATTAATFAAFVLAFAVTMALPRRGVSQAAIAGMAGAYGNIGYMGPGLALAVLGTEAAVPVALIFCFDNILLFTLVPFLMALAGTSGRGFGSAALEVAQRIVLHPFIIATAAGVLAAALQIQLPVALDRLMEFLQNAAAPCALFALGVTVALRPLKQVPWEVPIVILIKLLLHPVIVLVLLSALGPLPPAWVYTAVLMAALPPALNVFIIARQYGVWVPQASGSVLLGTLVSVVTLTTTMWLVKTGLLPHSLFP